MDTPQRPGDPAAHQLVTASFRPVPALPVTGPEWLKKHHRNQASDPIRGPDEFGAFPDALLWDVPPVVPDANLLRDDIGYACRNDQRTTLVNCANHNAIRLFCADHVLAEVEEHAEEWTRGSVVSRDQFLDRWAAEYVPLLRRLRPPEGLLHPDEEARIAELARRDSDDVPSATLTLLLGAFYLTRDGPALEAVYGPDFAPADHDKWVNMLQAGGDAGVMGEMVQIAIGLTATGVNGVIAGLRRVIETMPWVLFPAGVIVAATWDRLSTTTKQTFRERALQALEVAGRFAVLYHESQRTFAGTLAPQPRWESLAEAKDPSATLTRACLRILARSPLSHRSAEDLAAQLPYLPVAHGTFKVREVLRDCDAFHEVFEGRWQVGYPVR